MHLHTHNTNKTHTHTTKHLSLFLYLPISPLLLPNTHPSLAPHTSALHNHIPFSPQPHPILSTYTQRHPCLSLHSLPVSPQRNTATNHPLSTHLPSLHIHTNTDLSIHIHTLVSPKTHTHTPHPSLHKQSPNLSANTHIYTVICLSIHTHTAISTQIYLFLPAPTHPFLHTHPYVPQSLHGCPHKETLTTRSAHKEAHTVTHTQTHTHTHTHMKVHTDTVSTPSRNTPLALPAYTHHHHSTNTHTPSLHMHTKTHTQRSLHKHTAQSLHTHAHMHNPST